VEAAPDAMSWAMALIVAASSVGRTMRGTVSRTGGGFVTLMVTLLQNNGLITMYPQ
jgi:hypothetical protein